MKFNKIIFIFILLFSLSTLSIINANEQTNVEPIEIFFFYSTGCPACGQMTPVLESFVETHNIILNKHNVSNRDSVKLFEEKLSDYEVPRNESGYVPTVFIKDFYFVGYSSEIIKKY
jgi:thiol-disulfide isomerase/thioredoxin